MSESYEFGKQAEEIAVKYLISEGFEIIQTNWRYGRLEIDIIARKNRLLHIVEVKARTGKYFQSPEDAVNKVKQKKLIEAANAYVQKEDVNLEVQFDIISVLNLQGKYQIEYLADAFYPHLK